MNKVLPENSSNGEVATVPWVAGSHHVLGIEHLLGKFWHRQGPVLLAATGSERSKTRHKEMKTWEWYHVDRQLTEISIKLAWESEASGHTRHCEGNEVVQVTIRWVRQFQSTETNIIEGFVVNAVCFICILN